MTYFARYDEPDLGFATVAGRDEGLHNPHRDDHGGSDAEMAEIMRRVAG